MPTSHDSVSHTQRVIEKVMESGSWEGVGGPHYMREDGVPHGPASLSTFAPNWLAQHRKKDPAAGPAPCPQPAGDG